MNSISFKEMAEELKFTEEELEVAGKLLHELWKCSKDEEEYHKKISEIMEVRDEPI